MRRLLLTSCAILSLTLAGSGATAAAKEAPTSCSDYCGNKAAAHCSNVDSWACDWYIIGCLAGCGVAKL